MEATEIHADGYNRLGHTRTQSMFTRHKIYLDTEHTTWKVGNILDSITKTITNSFIGFPCPLYRDMGGYDKE